jgi:hypothetical protein
VRFSATTGKALMMLGMLNVSRASNTQLLGTSKLLHQLGAIDLTGAELEYAESRLTILNGKLGRIDPKSSLTNGHLSVISQVKPSLFSSRVQIAWRNHQFEVIMISAQELTLEFELKLKFIARWIRPVETKVLSL